VADPRRAATTAAIAVILVVVGSTTAGAVGTPTPVAAEGRVAPQADGDPAAEARREARRILDQPRYKPPPQPRPLRGFFRWLGKRLEPVLDRLAPLGRPFAFVFRAIAESWKWSLLVGGAVALLALFVCIRLVRRRGRGLVGAAGAHRDRTRHLDPDALERGADLAEADGRFDEAFRLRFLAGLVRLDRAGVVELKPSLTSGALRRRVRSSSLRGLSVRFDEIVYGGRPAGPADMEQARREWPRALEEVNS
jgi:hypothetical protein